MISNLSAPKIPMTAWILAHKLGHSLQDHFVMVYERDAYDKIERLLHRIFKMTDFIAKPNDLDNLDTDSLPHVGIYDKMTSRAARKGQMTGPFEVFPELMAQYLIKGYIELQNTDQRAIRILNNMMKAILDQLVGKVFLEV
jgi:hypothetical protein